MQINTREAGEDGVSILGHTQKLSGHGAGHQIQVVLLEQGVY